jgi:hypothetical protein
MADPFGDEDASSSEEEWDAPAKQPAKSKPKTKLELAIEAREAREAALRSSAAVPDFVEGESETERKARLEAAQQASDRAAAADAFGTADDAAAGGGEAALDLETFAPMNPHAPLSGMLPDTPEEFELFLEKLLGSFRVTPESEEIPIFINDVMSRVCKHLKGFEISVIDKALVELQKEKLEEQREKDGKKKSKVNTAKKKLGKNSRLSKKGGGHKSGTDGDIIYDKYEEGYDSIMDRY